MRVGVCLSVYVHACLCTFSLVALFSPSGIFLESGLFKAHAALSQVTGWSTLYLKHTHERK